MHVPDGFLDAPTSIATGVVAAVGRRGRAARRARELDDRTAPMAGLVAAFVFAAQMLNFPVGAGTSGHLLGGALAAVLVGPWTAVLCLSVVLARAGPALRRRRRHRARHQHHADRRRRRRRRLAGLRRPAAVLPKRLGLVAPAAAVAAFVSVPVAALVFVGLYAVGGTAPVDARRRADRDARLAHRHRPRRGRHHRPRGRQRGRRPPRPGPRRPPAAGRRELEIRHGGRDEHSRAPAASSPSPAGRLLSPASSASTPARTPTG